MSSVSNFQKLTYDTISTITTFLTVTDINSLSSTCKEFNNMFSIKVESQQVNQLVESQFNADILYLSAKIEEKKAFDQKIYSLQCLKFNITTKDQGWVKDCESGSWIEAEFINTNQQTSERVSSQGEGAKKRDPIIYNYEVRDYQRKSKTLHRSCFPIESNQVNVHLRSEGEGWEISCKRGEIQKFYTQFITLSSKQVESLNLNFKKKTSRRLISRR